MRRSPGLLAWPEGVRDRPPRTARSRWRAAATARRGARGAPRAGARYEGKAQRLDYHLASEQLIPRVARRATTRVRERAAPVAAHGPRRFHRRGEPAALAPRPPERYETLENTMFGSKCFKFLGSFKTVTHVLKQRAVLKQQ